MQNNSAVSFFLNVFLYLFSVVGITTATPNPIFGDVTFSKREYFCAHKKWTACDCPAWGKGKCSIIAGACIPDDWHWKGQNNDPNMAFCVLGTPDDFPKMTELPPAYVCDGVYPVPNCNACAQSGHDLVLCPGLSVCWDPKDNADPPHPHLCPVSCTTCGEVKLDNGNHQYSPPPCC